ncbi:nuclear distribution protein nudE-like 1-B [Ctenocephalides felis]|uniref:nuclear distribution protein nudE-like 1-B n=1 Tax=Ctenocephalides felis TaxID=7515 RepID=UPI000E6E31B5|nr:nuclear distribution protein nudE-like 1-B [Ctenocephalides felis]XP_026467082.1 nuclear distribution protein nudE-like 1-B [Ctenocephalides felis]
MDVPQLANKDQEIAYWKDLANKYLQEKTDAQQELEDFSEESRQLECELEASLEQSENVIRDLRLTIRNLQAELESSKNKLEKLDKENCSLEINCNALSSEKEKLLIYIRELEQKNDDLERAHRNVTESVATFEDLLNKAYEKNALLENEVGEKENLQVQLQRMRDEARDLQQELKIKVKDGDKSLMNGYSNSYMNLSLDSNRLHCEMETQTVDNQTSVKNQPSNINGNGLTSGGRIIAMNIVGDLLRKVGNMEAKLSKLPNDGGLVAQNGIYSGDTPPSTYRNRRSTRTPNSPLVLGCKYNIPS